MKVAWIQNENVRRPDLPEGVSYVVTKDDGVTAEVEITGGHHLLPADPITSQLGAIFDSLPVEVKVAFIHLRPAIRDALQDGDVELARAVIATQSVPPELEPLKQQMLSILQ